MLIDQDTARIWADHHVALGHWARRTVQQVGEAFSVLARIQYDRPWSQGRGNRTHH